LKKIDPKYRGILSLIIKLVFAVAILGSLYFQVFENEGMKKIYNVVYKVYHIENLFWSILLIMLCVVNWGTEAFKWNALMRLLEPISFKRSVKAILSGLSIASLSPNRIGEFAGRILYLKKANKIRGVLLNFISNLSLLVVNYILGIIAFLIFYLSYFKTYDILFYSLSILGIIIGVVMIYMYYNIRHMSRYLIKLPKLHGLKHYLSTYNLLDFPRLNYYLSLSLFRYVVFTVQYLITLKIFGVQVDLFYGVIAILSIFFVQLVMPSFILLEIGIRVKAALFFIGAFSSSENELILASSFALWFINLIIPGLFGTIFILKLNFWKAIKIKW